MNGQRRERPPTFCVGRWEFTVERMVSWDRYGLGIEVYRHTWRRAYPWLSLHLLLGPFWISVDAVRPDTIAVEMRRERWDGTE